MSSKFQVLSSKTRGQSTLEILIALTLLVVSVSAVIIVGFGNQSSVIDSQLNNKAIYIARSELENVRATARRDFSAVKPTSTNDGTFNKDILVENLGMYEKKVTERLTWDISPLRNQEIALTTIVTDWRAAFEQAKTGDGGTGLSGDWKNPRTAGTEDLGPGNEGRDIAIKGNTVFVVGTAADTKKNDFFSIDVSNINSPYNLNSINTGPGLEAVALWENYAYVAGKNASQLQVIDISNPASLSLVGGASLSGNTQAGKSVFARNGYTYIGTGASSGRELQIFSISNPSSPSLVGSIEIGAAVNDIYVFGDRLYLSTSRSDAEIMIFDVSNPSAPAQLGIYNHAGSGQSFAIFAASFGDAYAGIGNSFVILNTSDIPSGITARGSFDAGGQINDIYMRDYLAFLATSNSNREFQAINITTPETPLLHSTFDFPQVASGITYKDNVVYVSVRSNDALRIITSSP